MNFRTELDYKKVHGGYVVFIKGREAHAHFNNERGCLKLIRLLRYGRIPSEPYFRNAAKRLLTAEEFEALEVER